MKLGPGAVRIGDDPARRRLPAWPLLAMAFVGIAAGAVWALVPVPRHEFG